VDDPLDRLDTGDAATDENRGGERHRHSREALPRALDFLMDQPMGVPVRLATTIAVVMVLAMLMIVCFVLRLGSLPGR
jgi:hypothetical protein